jgi:lantibiotic transport system ATP-binding protein
MNIIETHDLSYRFSPGVLTLTNINLKVPSGSIYGFLGPNGAGKTTTLKLILGLLKLQQGTINLFGKELRSNRIEILQKLGSLIETPSLYSHLTALQNLEVLQKIYRCPPSRLKEVLEIVGLTSAAKKKASQFSLGMKQRLSIAIALVHNPELLILDEPTNGLDPSGIIEMRELFKQLNQHQQMTIVISSHLLPEIEKIATHIGIINKGQMVFEGTKQLLQQRQIQNATVTFETSDPVKTMEVFQSHNLAATLNDGSVQLTYSGKELVGNLTRQLVYNNVDIYQIRKEKNDLEAIFMDITAN